MKFLRRMLGLSRPQFQLFLVRVDDVLDKNREAVKRLDAAASNYVTEQRKVARAEAKAANTLAHKQRQWRHH